MVMKHAPGVEMMLFISSLTVSRSDIGPLINLGTQHDGRSARTWMKRVLTTFVVVMGGRKGFAREHQNGFL